MLLFIRVRVCTSVDLGQWLYLVVTLIEVNSITALSSLRAKIRINTIFHYLKNMSLVEA
jgi:hypothetical protein